MTTHKQVRSTEEALTLALEALESFAPHNGVFWRNLHKDDAEIAKAITAIKALHDLRTTSPYVPTERQRTWVSLTDEEIINEADRFDWDKDCAVRFARSIEAKLKEKNNHE